MEDNERLQKIMELVAKGGQKLAEQNYEETIKSFEEVLALCEERGDLDEYTYLYIHYGIMYSYSVLAYQDGDPSSLSEYRKKTFEWANRCLELLPEKIDQTSVTGPFQVEVLRRASNLIAWDIYENAEPGDMEKLKKGLDIIEKGVSISSIEDPTHYNIRATKACLLIKMERIEEAYAVVKSVLDRQPDFPDFQGIKGTDHYQEWAASAGKKDETEKELDLQKEDTETVEEKNESQRRFLEQCRTLKKGTLTEQDIEELISLSKQKEFAEPLLSDYGEMDVALFEGDAIIDGDFLPDRWGLAALVVKGNLTINGLYRDFDDPAGFTLVTGDLKAKDVITAGQLEIHGNLEVTHYLVGDYNDYSTLVCGDVSALFFFPENHYFEFKGKMKFKHAYGDDYYIPDEYAGTFIKEKDARKFFIPDIVQTSDNQEDYVDEEELKERIMGLLPVLRDDL
jgi:tetratricopeptide (TPR) repeat protein